MYSFLLILFVLCAMAIMHTYLFYPIGLLLFAKKKKEDIVYNANDEWPEVTVLVAAYNEEKVIDAKIRSVVQGNYPVVKLRMLVGSDASTDNTNAIVRKWSEQYDFIELVPFAGRTGKAGIINQLVQRSKSPILVLTDANVMFTPGTILNMVRHFKRAKVAQVCANIIKTGETKEGISSQEITYIALENKIKLQESNAWHLVMGAEGGCNAIRRENYAIVPANFCVDDFYISMNVIEQGKEIVFDEQAVCYEDAPSLRSVEFARKVRISMGNFQNLARYGRLLLPFWKGSAFAFLSHKVLRWVTPFLLIVCLFTSLGLGFYNPMFFVVFALQLAGLLTPLIRINSNLYKVVSHFYLMNLALLKGFFVFVKGVESNIWQPTKRNV